MLRRVFLAKIPKIQKIAKSGKPLVPSFPDNGSHTVVFTNRCCCVTTVKVTKHGTVGDYEQ
jgi:hypothetical protein